MNPPKALGLNGPSTLFFQNFWHIVGTYLIKMNMDIINNNKDSGVLNNTFIALIPKCKNPSSPKDFCLISLCNVAMKVVTKTIANKLKMILSEVIEEEQSALVQD